jgi:hypothetical protein
MEQETFEMEVERERVFHAKTLDGGALCGKHPTQFEKHEFLQGPYWDGVNCPACNEGRRLFKNDKDVALANKILGSL